MKHTMNLLPIKQFVLFIVIATAFPVGAAELYVAKDGKDSNPGTFSAPFGTIQKAVDVVGAGDTVYIRAGRYHEAVEVKDLKGSPGKPILFAAYKGEKVTLDGSEPITAKWTKHKGSIYKTKLDKDIWQLFVNDKSATSARWPNGNWYDGSVWDKTKSMAWPEKKDSSFGHHFNKALKTLDFSLEDGGIIIVNSGSFKTYKGLVLKHSPASDNFKYNTRRVRQHFGDYPIQKQGYFIEGKPGLIDVPGEWFYEPKDKTLYLWAEKNRNPNDLEIRGKTITYALDIEDSSYISIRGIDFFGATFKSEDSSYITIEDCRLLYPSYSKRMLRELGDMEVTSMLVRDEFDPAYNTVRNCVFEYADGPAIHMNGVGNTVENCYMHDIDYSCTYAGGWTINMVDAPQLTFRRNTVHTTGPSELLKAGRKNVIELNDLSRSGYLQNDGSLIQVSVKQQDETETRYNWVHDSVKIGIRFDNSNRPGSPWGENSRVHHNVGWKTNRLFFKGDKHYIYNNLAFDNRLNDLTPSSDIKTNGRNFETITRNNIVSKFSGHRTGPGKDHPVPGIVDHNWAANFKGRNIRTQLRDPDNLDFRPKKRAEVVDAGAGIEGFDIKYTGKGIDIGPYEYGDENYWIPGRQWPHASSPVPPDEATNVKTDADLMWLKGYQREKHRVYFGSSRSAVEKATPKAKEYKGEFTNNIYTPDRLVPGRTYYWRVDAIKNKMPVKGKVWCFKVELPEK